MIFVRPIRYLGYGFPAAEALYFSFPEDHWTIDICYTVSGAYIISHVMWSTLFSFSTGNGVFIALAYGLKTLLWELLASTLIPSLVVSGGCSIVKRLYDPGPPILTALGLCMLPLISAPIDFGVNFFFFVDRGVNMLVYSMAQGLQNHRLPPDECRDSARFYPKSFIDSNFQFPSADIMQNPQTETM